MLIHRISALTGLPRKMEIPCTLQELNAWRNGVLAQDAFPSLSADEREFIMTGVTPEEWEAEILNWEIVEESLGYPYPQGWDEIS